MENNELVLAEKKEDIQLDANGLIIATTLTQLFRIANMYLKSKLLPKEYDSPEKVVTAFQFARELGLSGLTALREISVINGKPDVFGTLPLAIVQASGQLESIREFYIDKDSKEICFENSNFGAPIFGSVTILKRKGDEHPLTSVYTLAQAGAADLFKNVVWVKYPERMLRYRARSAALKDKFADVLRGTSIKEYDTDIDDNVSVQHTHTISHAQEFFKSEIKVSDKPIIQAEVVG